MAFPETMPVSKTPRANFVPFAAMSTREQAEHLVVAHGMGADYHGDLTELGLPSDAMDTDLITWHEGLEPELLTRIHNDDEDYFAAEYDDLHAAGFAAFHTHSKEA